MPGREIAAVIGIEHLRDPQICQPGCGFRQIACRNARAVWIADGAEATGKSPATARL